MTKPLNRLLLILAVCAAFPGILVSQTTPPTVNFTTPAGIQRGTRSTVLVEGTGLEGATAIVFSEPGLSARILEVSEVPQTRLDLETKIVAVAKPYFREPVKMQAKVDVTAEKWTAAGTHLFRVITPHGSSTPGRLVISTFPELEEREPNSQPTDAQPLTLPVTVNGVVLSAGDDDYYRFQASAGQEVVFQVNSMALGSSLDPLLDVYDSRGQCVASNREQHDRTVVGYRVPGGCSSTL